MKVRIVEKKEDAEMTIEELAEERYIGIEYGEDRFMVAPVGGGYAIVRAVYYLSGDPTEKKHKLQEIKDYSNTFYHCFDTARELYLWMAE